MRVWALLLLAAALAAADPPPAAVPDTAAHVAELRQRHGGLAGFRFERCGAFLVITDDDEAGLRRHLATVAWFTAAMRRQHFARDPEGITDIWLFRDKRSYETNAEAFFGAKPTSPFGYFSRQHGLVMNIATGGGTLCHELVHAFMRANFPACPDWLNEGLASLYEQCGQRGEGAAGLVNWRLDGLQTAIRDGTLPTFEGLCGADFYGANSGRNYAQARYLCLWLQEQGTLPRLLELAQTTHAGDPSGWTALQRALAEPDLPAFEQRWRTWVLGLKLLRR